MDSTDRTRLGSMSISRETRTLIATAVLAAGVPAIAAGWTSARTADLADRLTLASGVPVSIGAVDAELGGTVRLSDVAFGDLVTADAIEGSVGMSSLLDGRLRADEIRVETPHVAVRVDADGDSDVARLARRLAAHRPSGGTGSTSENPSVRRIVVAGGTLTARVAGVGELSADGVELVPDGAGVRIVTGPVRLKGGNDQLAVDVAFERSAAELGLPHMRFGRVLAVGGAGTLTTSARRGPDGRSDVVVLRDLAAGRRAPGGTLEVRAAVDDQGTPRALAIDLALTRTAEPEVTITLRGEHVPLRALGAIAPRGIELWDARATGELAVRRGPRGLQLAIAGELEHVVVDHRTFAPEPVALTGVVHAELAITADAITLANAGVKSGGLELDLAGWIRRGSPTSGQLDVQLVQAACADQLAALPDTLRGPLDGMTLAGALGGRARLAIDLAAPPGEGATLSTQLTGDCRVVAEPPAADVTRLAGVSEQRLADGSRVRVGKGEPEWTSLRGLPAHVADAFVSAEDGRFHTHAGFDLEQIARSLEIDLRERRLVRGGSTISQQLVKNAFLTQRRSFDRKLQEAILTWRLEARLDKRQILERYLNIIELGPRVFGITAAARHWFGVTPRELTVKQAAFLAALTSQPASMSRRVRRARGLDPDSAERVAVVLRAMRRTGALGADAFEAMRTMPLYFAPTAIAPER